MVDADGTVVANYSYDPYGNIISATGDLVEISPLRYRGYYYDSDSGLYYVSSRYYDPAIGRFINADSYVSTGESLLGYNTFAYCNNNPVNYHDSTGNALDTIFDLVSLASSVVEVAVNPGDPWAWAGLAGDLVDVVVPFVGGVGEVVRAANTARKAMDTADDFHDTVKVLDKADDLFVGGLCFVAGTLVLTDSGAEAIETIQEGDLVWAWDEVTGDVALKEVVETYVNQTEELFHLYVNGEEIITTPSHPFYSPVKGWTEAVHLRAGDILVLVNGEYVVVERVQHEILETPVIVYNYQVEDYHTYYVSESGILVHNSCKIPENFSPAGAGRHGAFNQAKRDLGTPVTKQPVVLPNIDRRGNTVPGRVYDFDGIQIRDDVIGHSFSDGGYLPPHFNTPDGKHYFY